MNKGVEKLGDQKGKIIDLTAHFLEIRRKLSGQIKPALVDEIEPTGSLGSKLMERTGRRTNLILK